MDGTFQVFDEFGLNHGAIEKRIQQWSDDEFLNFFAAYENVRLAQPLVSKSEKGATDIFPDCVSGRMPIDVIKQLCVYVNRVFVHDPILDLKGSLASIDTHFERIIRTPERRHRLDEFRNAFEKSVEEFLLLRPLAEMGIVHVTPTQLATPSREPGALYADDLYGPYGQYSDGEITLPVLELPKELADYINENIRISPAEINEVDGVMIHPHGPFEHPTRTIAVRFADERQPMIFCLSSASVNREQADNGKLAISMVYPKSDQPQDLDENTFRQWVIGESQKYVKMRLEKLNANLFLASLANAHFLTTIPSSRDLASLLFDKASDASSIVKTVLEVELPYFSKVAVSDLAKARRDEASFQEFRVAFEKAFTELEGLTGVEKQRKANEIFQDLVYAPIARIDKRMKSLYRNVFVDSAISVGAFATTLISGGSTLLTLAALAASAKAADSYKKAKAEEDKIQEHSSFFYWQATRKSRSN